MKKVFCTGHRDKKVNPIDLETLVILLSECINLGVLDFYSGGARGWDTYFAYFVIILRDDDYFNVKLHLVLPCPPEEQTADWDPKDIEMYEYILEAADSVEIVSPHYDKNCMKKRNERLVELGEICLCYYNEKRRRSGTGQTVRMAEKKGKGIVNFYFDWTKQ